MPPSESDFIDWIKSQQRPSPLVQLAAGDDLAILKWPATDLLLIGGDQVLDGVHFDSAKHSPRDIGAKAMNRNLSDCAAMAALPAAAVAIVALPRTAGLEYAKDLYQGLRIAGEKFNCPLVGGDTATWDGKLALTVSILAKSDGISPITRSGAKPGDKIYVTGPLGGSILSRHLTFTPRIHEARTLAQSSNITSMIDISDGLSRDLANICRASNVGAILHATSIPIHPDAITLSRQSNKNPIDHALHDGEDHELLFTTPDRPSIGTLIGQITADRSLLLEKDGQRIAIPSKGWEYRL